MGNGMHEVPEGVALGETGFEVLVEGAVGRVLEPDGEGFLPVTFQPVAFLGLALGKEGSFWWAMAEERLVKVGDMLFS
jgi:hypothetical protein